MGPREITFDGKLLKHKLLDVEITKYITIGTTTRLEKMTSKLIWS